MNDLTIERIRHASNTEVVRRMLIRYFIGKGFTESFDRLINPVLVQDLPLVNFGLDTKVEIEASAGDVDPTTSRATINWNLFVLGNQRMYLGETTHENLPELARQIRVGQIMVENAAMSRRCTTPRRIITFITKVLGESQAGYVDLTPRTRQTVRAPRSARTGAVTGAQSGQFMTRSGYGT